MNRAHYSDEKILALLDGEFPKWRTWRARRHLKLCWDCRRRMMEISEGASELSRTFSAENAGLPREMLDRSRQALLERLQAESAAPPQPDRTRANRIFIAAAAAAGLAACVIVLFVYRSPGRPPAAPPADIGQVLRAAEISESTRLPGSAKQIIEVEFEQTSPRPVILHRRIEMISDAQQRRARIRWSRQDGRILRTLWSKSSGGPESLIPTNAFADASDLAALEAALLAWLESRDWRPIGFSDGFARYASGAEATLWIERDGSRIVARRRIGDCIATVSLELDPNKLPRIQTIRLERSGRVFEIRLRPVQWIALRHHEVQAALGEHVHHVPPAGPIQDQPARPDANALAAALLNTYWTVHQLDGCTREDLNITADEGLITISGITASAERRVLFENAFQGTHVKLRLRSPESAGLPPVGNILRLVDRNGQAAGFPLEPELTAYVQTQPGGDARVFAHAVVTASERTAAQAFALRRLARAFPPHVTQRLGQADHLRLKSLLDAHLTALADAQAALRHSLLPLFGASPAAPAVASGTWQESVLALCDHVDASHRRVYHLFTIGYKSAEPIAAARTALMESLDDGVRKLEAASSQTESLATATAELR